MTNLLTCYACNINLYEDEASLEMTLGRFSIIGEEEHNARQQVEEDLRLYENRLEPPDAIDIDEEEQQTGRSKGAGKHSMQGQPFLPELEKRVGSEPSITKVLQQWNGMLESLLLLHS